MSYFDDTVPAETEAAKRGASRIRDIKTALNTLIAKVFTDAGEFLTGWITTDQVADSAVTTAKLAASAVTSAKIAAGAVGTSQVANAAITLAKLASDAVPATKMKTGQYTGNNGTVAVTGVGFAPDFLIVVEADSTAVGVAFRAEGSQIHPCFSSSGSHDPWGGGTAAFSLASVYSTAMAWGSDGFTVGLGGTCEFNKSGTTYTYLALKV